jgi:hypothetical protein
MLTPEAPSASPTCFLRCLVYLLYQYKRTNADTSGAVSAADVLLEVLDLLALLVQTYKC